MSDIIQAIRGMHDILPAEIALWQFAEAKFRALFKSFAFQEIRFPIVEKTELFKRSIGDVTDIVEKEMYTFLDRNNDSLSLRPEGTACCVRAGVEHGLLYNQIQRLWYGGPFFRHERPQKGRCRQFHQYSAEVFGLEGPDIDAEIIFLSAELLKAINIDPYVTLQLNTLGTPAARLLYREKLIAFLEANQSALDSDSLHRLHKNPMRILDSKNPSMQELIHAAPKLINYLDDESLQHFEQLQLFLRELKIKFVVNPFLVRGLDYYTKTVFEWVTSDLGAQGTVCSGGRYDGLVQQLAGKATPAVGFSLGLERAVLLMQQKNSVTVNDTTDIYIVVDNHAAFTAGLKISALLRNKFPQLSILLNAGGGSFKNQFKKANKAGAKIAIIIGENELKANQYSLKNLEKDFPQQHLTEDELLNYFLTY